MSLIYTNESTSSLKKQTIYVHIEAEGFQPEILERLQSVYDTTIVADEVENGELTLKYNEDGLSLVSDGQILRGDFTKMLPRLKPNNLSHELLVKAAKIKDHSSILTAVDATAGLGDDSLLLAAAGFHVTMFERNPVVYELLRDAIRRAVEIPELSAIVSHMHVIHDDSISAMKHLEMTPDVILLDPMFPERQKSALVKKKLQMIQKLEIPCMDEVELLQTAMHAKPKKLIVKRPPKGPHLAGITPDYTNEGKAVRFDCFVSPYDRIHKFKFES